MPGLILANVSWLDTLPAEIRLHIFSILGIVTEHQHTVSASALLDGISLSLAYPQFVELCQCIQRPLESIPAVDGDEVTRLSNLFSIAASSPKNHVLLQTPKSFNIQLDLLASYSAKEYDTNTASYSPPQSYQHILSLCPNISALTITGSPAYSQCAQNERALVDLIKPIARHLHELRLSVHTADNRLFGSLQRCFEHVKLQKVVINGFMSAGIVAFLKEQRYIKHFVATDINAHALEQAVQYWPTIEDFDLSGIQLITSSQSVCKAIYQCSSQLKRLTLIGASDVELRTCLVWMTDEDDYEIAIENIGNSYRSVIACCASLTHLSISKLPICGDELLHLLRKHLSKLEKIEFVSRTRMAAA